MRWKRFCLWCVILIIPVGYLMGEEEEYHTVRFYELPIVEFIQFVSKISGQSFLYNKEDLSFSITFAPLQSVTSSELIKVLLRFLQLHHFGVKQEESYYVVQRYGKGRSLDQRGILASADDRLWKTYAQESSFDVYKLQYHEGEEIVSSLKNIARSLGEESQATVKAIESLQWVRSTNSLLFSGSDAAMQEVSHLIQSLDVPLRQVLIEVLVIETDVHKGLDFGLQWSAGGRYRSSLGGGFGNIAPHDAKGASFAHTMQGIDPAHPPQGLSQIPLASGFDLGVIGDIIMHKGSSYISLGSLVTALQLDGDSTIVLNQKLITQDNKHSRIFVGDNIPFTGSVVTTVGQGQQTSANVEYRDVGVSLNITPKLGEDDIITLSLDEEITEVIPDHLMSSSTVNGIRTTKTNMLTHVHVPDQHFLVLSGMIRNAKSVHRSSVPCLGGLPWIGALFSRSQKEESKRNVVIFVRPQIIHSFEEYSRMTKQQTKLFQSQADQQAFQSALDLMQK